MEWIWHIESLLTTYALSPLLLLMEGSLILCDKGRTEGPITQPFWVISFVGKTTI